jgi:hypothetical protein
MLLMMKIVLNHLYRNQVLPKIEKFLLNGKQILQDIQEDINFSLQNLSSDIDDLIKKTRIFIFLPQESSRMYHSISTIDKIHMKLLILQ